MTPVIFFLISQESLIQLLNVSSITCSLFSFKLINFSEIFRISNNSSFAEEDSFNLYKTLSADLETNEGIK